MKKRVKIKNTCSLQSSFN